jgi:hypothetical protein
MSIDIVAINDEKTRYWLRADLNEQGDLVLAGQDLSPHVGQLFLRDEYEYWYTVKAVDVPRLLDTLGASASSATNLAAIAEVLRERFARTHGISTSTAFKAWCKEHDIPYAFTTD